MIDKLTKEQELVPLKTNTFITTSSIVNNTDVILFYYHPQATFMKVPQKFNDSCRKLDITFIFFVSMCIAGEAFRIKLSSERYSLHLLRFALIFCTWMQSIPSNVVPI